MTELRYFSHTDLDGVMSAYTMMAGTKNHYPDAEVAYSFESTGAYGSIDSAIMTWLATEPKAAFIGITDLTPAKATLEALKAYCESTGCAIEVIDHHASAAALATEFNFITNYNQHADGKLTCATSMVAEIHPTEEQADMIIEAVREIDTWDWQNNPESPAMAELAQKLGEALNLLGKETFMAQVPNFYGQAKTLATPDSAVIFGPIINGILNQQLAAVDRYVAVKKDRAKFIDLTIAGVDYHVAYVSAHKNLSEVGNMLAELPEADFGLVINGEKISLRSKEAAPVDLSQVAQAFNGGGHAHAAGGRLVINYEDILRASIIE